MSFENDVRLIGNVVADAELRYTPSGQPVCNFRMATNKRWTGKDGQKHEHTEFHRIVAWGKLAENAHEFCKKGRQLAISGEIQQVEYEDKALVALAQANPTVKINVKRYSTEVKINGFRLLGRKPETAETSSDNTALQQELQASFEE